MKILVSNDDGVLSPGIRILSQTLQGQGEVEVMAPDRNRSGASNSLSLLHPLRVRQLDNGYYSVDGTPTDCVHLALSGYFERHFDIVVSGINEGANLGDDVLYSGTVAAAIEACNLGLPAIAVSLIGHDGIHFQTAATIVCQLLEKLAHQPLPANTLLNVNVPDRPISEIKGIEITRLGSRHKAEPIQGQLDPRHQPIYWIGASGPVRELEPGTDFFAIERGFVSVTPLHLDMTHYAVFDQLSTLTQGIKLS